MMPRSPWEPVIDIERDSEFPPFLQIARSLAADIQRGRLRPGDRLPGSRPLAEKLQVHRNTVLEALDELAAEGWIESAPGRGTFVARALIKERAI
jgi:GntR family transcriptional regulator/MocR family aminotransferase